MATRATVSDQPAGWRLKHIASFQQMRALAWRDDVLYASREYKLFCAQIKERSVEWQEVGRYRPTWWRELSSSNRLSCRLFRDGFHALAVLPAGQLIAAVPGAIVTLAPGKREFSVTHRVVRGTRPLHIAVTPSGHAFWGEYFDNASREEVHVYASTDQGSTWDVAYTFPRGAIRHVHNIIYDEWENCLWVLTGDNGPECRILRASCDFSTVDVALSGNQQARAVALIPTPEALYFSSDTPLESNHVYRFDRRMGLTEVAALSSSSIYGCRTEECMFFSTMVEPSVANNSREAVLYGSRDGTTWQKQLSWKKDNWPMGLFQYGNICLPDGENQTDTLAITTIAVEGADLETSLWQIQP